MIKRIVKLTFQEDKVDDFMKIFHEKKENIRQTKGCLHLELFQSTTEKNVLFTYSFWQQEADLNAYRQSDFFQDTWKRTKQLFADKPEAWSVDSVEIL